MELRGLPEVIIQAALQHVPINKRQAEERYMQKTQMSKFGCVSPAYLALRGAAVFREDTQVNLALNAGFLGCPGCSRCRRQSVTADFQISCCDARICRNCNSATPLDDKAFEIYNGRRAPPGRKTSSQQTQVLMPKSSTPNQDDTQ